MPVRLDRVAAAAMQAIVEVVVRLGGPPIPHQPAPGQDCPAAEQDEEDADGEGISPRQPADDVAVAGAPNERTTSWLAAGTSCRAASRSR